MGEQMVYLGRRVMNDIKVLQEKMLAVIHPLAGNSCLNRCEYKFSKWALHTTYQHIPLLDVIEGMNTNIKLSHEAEDFNPE